MKNPKNSTRFFRARDGQHLPGLGNEKTKSRRANRTAKLLRLFRAAVYTRRANPRRVFTCEVKSEGLLHVQLRHVVKSCNLS